ncbi:MAG: SMC family ATPase, partial [Candidatus Thermoplasmatota archaeon]|nr:SMC family ATPase [Candidatus Thermoplasmatota archaeon]
MILKSLTLKNYRKFKDVTIEFPDGVTGVVGLNGVGKSTIFESVAFAIYGYVAARTSVDQIKRQGAAHSDSCFVELEFIFEGDNYKIVRQLSGKALTASAVATVNGKIVATGAETVSNYFQNKLGMDFRSFFTSIFAKQKELNSLSQMVASERRPLILKMLGIDSLDDVIKEIKSDKKEKDNLIERLNHELVDENGKDKISFYKEEITKLEKKQKENKLSIKTTKNKIQILKKELEKLLEDFKKNKNEYEKIKNKKEILTEKKILFEEKEGILKDIKNLSLEIQERQKNIEQQNKKLENFKDVEKQLESTKKRLDELYLEIEELVKKIEQKKTIVSGVKKEINEIDLKNKKILELGPKAKCPTCERVLAEQYETLLKKFNEEKKNKENEVLIYLKEVSLLEEKKDKLLREEQAFEKKRNYLENQFQEITKIQTTIKNLSKELEKEKNNLKSKQQRLKERESIKFDINEYNKIIHETEMFYNKYQESLEKKDNKKDELNTVNLELQKKESDDKLITQNINSFKEKIQELQRYLTKIKQEKISSNNLAMLSEVMSDFRTHLISRIRPILASYSSDFFRQLTDGKYSELELDENYNILVYDNGNAFKIERFSGGEEDLANLCLRLAISEVITERAGGVFNFIILDEIFGSQDIYRRQNILKALNSLSSKFRQIFLITHIDDVKNDMENIIFVYENEDGTSSVKI